MTEKHATEDIAIIAQHISDHAEAIYQSWKARGLSPNDIFKCHNSEDALSRFDKVLRLEPNTESQKSQNDSRNNGNESAAKHQNGMSNGKRVSVVNDNEMNKTKKQLSSERLEKLVDRLIESDKKKKKKSESKTATVNGLNGYSNGATKKPTVASGSSAKSLFAFKKNSIIYKNKPEIEQKSSIINVIDNSNTWPLKNGVKEACSVEKKLENLTLIACSKEDCKKDDISQISSVKTNGYYQGPTRPFLTRGSVAERVLIFEKRPNHLGSHSNGLIAKCHGSVKPRVKPTVQHTTLQRHLRNNRKLTIPKFYYPAGKPISASKLHLIKNRLISTFKDAKESIDKQNFALFVKACDFPLYWKLPLYAAVASSADSSQPNITFDLFLNYWQSLVHKCFDDASQFVYILTKGKRNFLQPEDFVLLIQDVIDTHPGLVFLKEAIEFHSRYTHTVIARIFYTVNRSWTNKISLSELRKSNLLSTIALLEHEEDINIITSFFSYEHFYVIYCKFWELDRDHDLLISRQDLMRHNDYAMSSRIVDQIFSGAVTRKEMCGLQNHPDKMSYMEFVWFLMAEEDKNQPTAIEYWFRCMDLDGDGFLSMYELNYFYEEQVHRMEAMGIETLPFEDCVCQMMDIIRPRTAGKITLSDLKKSKMTTIFFDTFFNLQKYLDFEQRDPFASAKIHDSDENIMSDWDRFAAEEYDLLVAEESAKEQLIY